MGRNRGGYDIPTQKPCQAPFRVDRAVLGWWDPEVPKTGRVLTLQVSFNLIPCRFVTLGCSCAAVALVSKLLLFSLPHPGMAQMWMSITTSLPGSPASPCGPSPRWWSARCTSVLPTTTSSASGCCSRQEPTRILTAAGPSTSKASPGAPLCVLWMLSCGTAVKQHLSTS